MTRGKDVPECIRNQVVGMRKAGKKFTEIGAELNIKKDTARQIWNRYQERGNCENIPRPGQPKALSESDLRQLKRHLRQDRDTRRQPLAEIIVDLNLSVCPKTVRTAIVDNIGMGHRIARKTPWLSKEQKSARLKFAKKYIHWTQDEWRRVIWTDEMSMQTGANQGRVWVWRFPEEEYKEDCCGATVIPGFEKVKIWGAMRYGKLSELVVLQEIKGEGKLNAKEYCEIIMDGELFTFWIDGMEDAGYVLVMEDGAPYHRGAASIRRKELEKCGWIGWGPGTWPSNSPDLNPIENLWHILKSNIRKRKQQPRNKKQLVEALQEEWKKLDMDIVNSLCDSMPRRLRAVIDANGGPTGY